MDWFSMIPAIAQVAGGAIASGRSQPLRDQALGVEGDPYRKALEMLMKEGYTPEQAKAALQGPSAMNGVEADPAAVTAQHQALAELQRASHEGYGIEDQAAMNSAMNDVDQRNRGAREAAMSGLAPGSGASIAARLNAQSNGANEANNRALQIAGQSRHKALEALAGYSSLGSQMRNQSFGEGAQKARATDAISEFNARNSTQNNQFNANAVNTGHIQDANNKLGALGAVQNGASLYGNALNKSADRKADQAMGTANAIGGIAGAVGTGITGEKKKKDDQ